MESYEDQILILFGVEVKKRAINPLGWWMVFSREYLNQKVERKLMIEFTFHREPVTLSLPPLSTPVEGSRVNTVS